ncbi:MAG: 4-hydroxy-tetrahydrodipicolinate synthase [Gammaproteobacteria bacterium]|nr:MAG: 4-hydroxy-tetrahydrodipicolinate synthase [Gammaproteobacteria bacterium]
MFSGSMVALVTPMCADGSVDEVSLEALVEFHIENGTDSILAVGTTGESATLDMDEHSDVIKKVVDYVDGRVPVIGGTGANSTSEALELTKNAKEAGCDACLLVTPYYNKPTQEGLYQHYKLIAQVVDIPQVLYNVPGRTACDMQPETVQRLSKIDNIVGIKEASGSIERIKKLAELCGSEFGVFTGDDDIACDAILAGASCAVSVTANVAPKLMHEMTTAAVAKDETTAREADSKLRGLHAAMFLESNPIPAKWALYDMGMIPEGIRLPLTPLSSEHFEAVRAAIKQANS